MFKNKFKDGKNNICGARIAQIRKALPTKISQRMFAEKLQLAGLDVDKNAIQKMESGQRFITDIELKIITNARSKANDFFKCFISIFLLNA